MERLYQIDGITFRYPKTGHDVLRDVSLELHAGQVLSVLGPNGAGKSTLLGCMAGMFRPQQGEVYLEDRPLHTMPRGEIARSVAYVQQLHVPAFSYTVLQFVMMGRAPHVPFFGRPTRQDEDIAWDAMTRIGVTHLANKPYTDISGGERQQCVIARALAQQPRVILFDEPAAHLDFGNQRRILRLIKRMAADGYAVVMTTHNPDHVLLLGDSAAVLNRDGYLMHGPVSEVLNERSLQRLYGTNIRMVHVDALGREAALHEGLDDSTHEQEDMI